MNVMWFSAGVSSAITLWLARNEIDQVIYQHIDDQHTDTMRFIKDISRLVDKTVVIRQSSYRSVENVCRSFKYINGARGAKCTEILKKRERKEWESDNPGDHTYYWGFDASNREFMRAKKLMEAMPKNNHRFPLIDHGLTKDDAHAMLLKLGIKRPVMYDLGYHNNNCVGCVKGGKKYWNMIRSDFPDVFASRSRLERSIGHSCINGVFLDELDPDSGKNEDLIELECGIMCWGALQ